MSDRLDDRVQSVQAKLRDAASPWSKARVRAAARTEQR